jgi:hypothetical protein
MASSVNFVSSGLNAPLSGIFFAFAAGHIAVACVGVTYARRRRRTVGAAGGWYEEFAFMLPVRACVCACVCVCVCVTALVHPRAAAAPVVCVGMCLDVRAVCLYRS